MKARFAAATLMILTVPVFASTLSSDGIGTLSYGQAGSSQPGQYTGDFYGGGAPFGDRMQQSGSGDMRPLYDRGRNNPLPPRRDASGVPDPRI